MDQLFHWEKENSKMGMERDTLLEKIKNLEEALDYERNRAQMVKSKTDLKKSESSSNFNVTEYSRFSNGWK